MWEGCTRGGEGRHFTSSRFTPTYGDHDSTIQKYCICVCVEKRGTIIR
jgi:hypothetical protein